MVQRLCVFLCLVAFTVSYAVAGPQKSNKNKVTPFHEAPVSDVVVTPTPDNSTTHPLVGTYTGLSGYYDYQTNGGGPEEIRINPANGNIHVIYMLATDSVNFSATRGTGYAFSTNGGASWNTFSNLRVPNRRSGFPSLDLGRGAIDGAALIANHSTISGTQATAFVDFPEGGGAFAEISAPPTFGSDDPIWPFVTGASDGSIVMAASRQTAGTNHIARTSDYTTWAPWKAVPDTNNSGGQYPVISTGTGRVAMVLNGTSSGVWLLESTDNGVTWPAHATKVFGPWPQTAESLAAWVAVDAVYKGDAPLAAFTVSTSSDGSGYNYIGSRIMFWSQATGLVTAVPHDTSLYLSSAVGQTNHMTVDYPAIGVSGNTIFITFSVFQHDTASSGLNYLDIYLVQSNNGGATWTKPVNISNTRNLDERYSAVSKYNPAGTANIVWQEDTQPGSAAFNDGAPMSRARQVFLRYQLTGVNDHGAIPTRFTLEQNYPNPFNPATKIAYTVGQSGPVSIKVYNTLGQEVASLVNEVRQAGNYEVTFDATSLASGMYVYRMQAGSFAESRKMLLVK